MRVTVIHNPEAGDVTLDEKTLRALLHDAGYRVTYRSTKEEGWKQALDDPGQLVVVAGGDGTVAKVARRLAGRGVPLALLPAGTANNIAGSLGVDGDPARLVAGWTTARATPVDLGRLDGPMGERWFMEAVGLGVFPEVMSVAKHRIPEDTPAAEQIPRSLDLMIELLERATPRDCTVIADDRDLSGTYLTVEVLNTRSFGPRVAFVPDADPMDGLLDVVAISDEHRTVAIELLHACREGACASLELPRVRARCVRLGWRSQALHLDDKLWPDPDDESPPREGAWSATIRVEAGAIEILL